MIIIFVEFIDQLIDYPINRASLTLPVFLSWSEDVHVVLGGGGGVSSHRFLSFFFRFFDVLEVPISIRIGTLWVQLILQFSTHHF